jgi:hypothetical protein
MDIQAIATRARLPVRKVRYVLDQRLLPGLRGRLQKHRAGRPRAFSPLNAYCIACAALLLDAGVRRKTVIEVMEWLAITPWPIDPGRAGRRTATRRTVARPRPAIEALFSQAREPVEVLIGDGVNRCVRLGVTDTGWIEPRTLALLNAHYRPRVLIRLDLGQLRTAFRAEQRG